MNYRVSHDLFLILCVCNGNFIYFKMWCEEAKRSWSLQERKETTENS